MGPPRRYTPDELLRVYERHPLREETILDRVRRSKPTLTGVSERDLAVDPRTGITDQNHIGGYEFVLQLGALLDLGAGSRVLDVGCGLGGPARVLAERWGCRVDGVDLSPSRCAAAERLTRLVGLADRVSFRCGDFLELELPAAGYDAVIGQSSLVHFADKRRLVERCARLLAPGGRLAVEDCYLASAPAAELAAPLERLAELWLSHFVTLDEWTRLERRASLVPQPSRDLTPSFVEYLRRLIAVSRRPPATELEAWRLGAELGEAGALVYARTVSRLL